MTRGGGERRTSLADVYPTIARWTSGYGWVEFGIDGLDRPFVRTLDEGGIVWESEDRNGTLDEALGELEEGISRFMEAQGFVGKPMHKDTARPSRKAETVARKPSKPPVDPALKKVEQLREIAVALRKGEDLSITRPRTSCRPPSIRSSRRTSTGTWTWRSGGCRSLREHRETGGWRSGPSSAG